MKRTPPQQKQARATSRPCRAVADVVDFPAVDRTPDPPKGLHRLGKPLWKEIAPMLFAQRILTRADLAALGEMCQLYGESQELRRNKQIPPMSMLTQLKAYFAEFGMTPASRSKVSAGEKRPDNPFTRNGKPDG